VFEISRRASRRGGRFRHLPERPRRASRRGGRIRHVPDGRAELLEEEVVFRKVKLSSPGEGVDLATDQKGGGEPSGGGGRFGHAPESRRRACRGGGRSRRGSGIRCELRAERWSASARSRNGGEPRGEELELVMREEVEASFSERGLISSCFRNGGELLG
jgi:hypothetical protein